MAAGPYYPDSPEWAKVSHLYTDLRITEGWTSAALAALS